MSNILDLSVLVREPLTIKNAPDGASYIIPGEVSTKFVIKMSSHYQEAQKIKDEKEALEKLKSLVVEILNLDKTKNVTLEHVEEHFDNIEVLKAIVEATFNHIRKITSDPNLNSPESEKK